MTEASSAPRVGRGLRLASLIGVLLVALVSASRADAQTLPEPVPSLLGPPTQDGKPVRVAVGVRILNIPMIDEVAQRVDMVGYLTAEWKDPRLAYAPREEKTLSAYFSRARSGCRAFSFLTRSVRTPATTAS